MWKYVKNETPNENQIIPLHEEIDRNEDNYVMLWCVYTVHICICLGQTNSLSYHNTNSDFIPLLTRMFFWVVAGSSPSLFMGTV